MKNLISLFIITALFAVVSCSEAPKKEVPAETETKTEMPAETKAEESAEVVTGTVTTTEAPAEEEKVEEKKIDYTKTPLEGYVASMDDLMLSGDGKVNKSEAEALVKNGKMLVFIANNQAYLVFTSNATYAAKDLAANAGGTLGIKGKMKTMHGQKCIIANEFIK